MMDKMIYSPLAPDNAEKGKLPVVSLTQLLETDNKIQEVLYLLLHNILLKFVLINQTFPKIQK